MNLLCIGINHRTAPLNVRESVWFSNEETARILPGFREQGLRECVLVSTCNRTELYAVPENDRVDADRALHALIRSKDAAHLATPQHFYVLRSLLAVHHLFNVASGADSMVLGDVQILNQMKEAFELARNRSTVGTILAKLFQAAFHGGKRARTETEISHGAVSVSYAAVELANKIFANISERKALLIGAGETGKLTARHLVGRIGKLYLANRTRERAEEIARELGGTVTAFDEISKTMETVDIVVSSVESPHPVLSAGDLHGIMKQRGNEPLFIIDIGVPRNVDPAANRIDNVFLHDIDSLNLVVDSNLQKRLGEIPKVTAIVYEELLRFYQWYNALKVTPTIQELRDQFEAIRHQEIEKTANKFLPEEREALEILTKRIVNKILHTPMINLKNGADGEASEETLKKISIVRSLFGLGQKSEKPAVPSGRQRSDEE